MWSTLQNTGLFSHGVYTPTAEKCDVEHICFHSVRLLRDPSFGYPEHSNWQRGFWQCSNFTGFTHPTKQTNKQTGTKFALNAIATETETHVNHPVIKRLNEFKSVEDDLEAVEHRNHVNKATWNQKCQS